MAKTFSTLLLLLLTLMPSAVKAQAQYAFYDYDSVLHTMSDYKAAILTVNQLRSRYEAEMQHSASEFNRMYEDFIEAQSTFTPAIMQKRMAELQDNYDRNLAFKADVKTLLSNTEKDVLAPVYKRLNETIKAVALRHGYAFVINNSDSVLSYVDPTLVDDITQELIDVLAEQ